MLAQNERELLTTYNLTGADVASYAQTGAINGYEYVDLGVSVQWATYKKVKANLINNKIPYREWDEEHMHTLAQGLAEMNKKWGY